MTYYDRYKNELKRLESTDELFSKKEVAELTGLTPRTIHYYTDEGLVIPYVNPTGKGTTRKYSRLNIFELLLARELAEHNILIRDIKQIMLQLRGGKKVIGKGKELLFICDHKGSQGATMLTAADENGYAKVNMAKYSSVIVFDISALRIRAGEIG